MLNKLLEYQEIDASLRDIEQKIAQSEERQRALSAKKFLDQVKERADAIDLKAEELSRTYENFKQKYQTLETAKADFESAIKDAEDENEVAYLQKKAGEMYNNMKELETITNSLQGDIVSLIEQYELLKKKTKSAQVQYQEYYPKYKELKISYQGEIEKLNFKLAEAKKSIEPQIMAKYEAKKKDIFPVLYPFKTGRTNACPKCGMEFSMVAMNNLTNNGVMECENCHSLVYKLD